MTTRVQQRRAPRDRAVALVSLCCAAASRRQRAIRSARVCRAASQVRRDASYQCDARCCVDTLSRAPRAARPEGTDRAIISSRSGGAMECGVAAAGAFGARAPPAHAPHPALSPTERSPAKAGLHVNFSDKGEVKERREKFLTAKYGSHQMALIRKRLAVEMWLYDELQKLYDTPESGGGGGKGGSQEVEVDIDELLDMDSDELRRRHLATLLVDAKKPQKDVHKFINELLEKAKTL